MRNKKIKISRQVLFILLSLFIFTIATGCKKEDEEFIKREDYVFYLLNDVAEKEKEDGQKVYVTVLVDGYYNFDTDSYDGDGDYKKMIVVINKEDGDESLLELKKGEKVNLTINTWYKNNEYAGKKTYSFNGYKCSTSIHKGT